MDDFYTAEEVGALLKVTPRTVRNLILNKELGAVKLGKQYRISKENLKQFLEKNKK